MNRHRFALALTLFALTLFAATTAVAADSVPVLLAAHRRGSVEIISPDALKPVTILRVGEMAGSATATPDGRTLLVSQALASNPRVCCALYALDLAAHTMSLLIQPAFQATTLPAGDRIFTQRGNVGVESFDAKTLQRLPTLASRAVYGLHISPDGRWLFGTTSTGDQLTRTTVEGPALHIFDLQSNRRVRQIPVPSQGPPAGTWLGGAFYLFAFDGRQGHLWALAADATTLGPGRTIALPQDLMSRNPTREPFLPALVGAGGRLFLYEVYGTKLDRRTGDQPLPGGVLEIDPASGRILQRLLPERHFARLVVAPDGETLWGIDVPYPVWQAAPRLLRINRRSGRIESERVLTPDVWSLDLASIPASLLSATAGTFDVAVR